MDPYIESPVHWQDFHSRFINSLSEVISDSLPGDYFARIQEDVLLLEPEPPHKRIGPDVLVARDPLLPADGATPAVAGATATAELEPDTLENIDSIDPHVEPFIEIIRLPGREVVTVVEVLSPTNKGPDGRAMYLDKRRRLLRRPVHVVEIDLLCAGRRLELNRPLPPGHYYTFVSRADRRPKCDVYHWTVRDPLPSIPVPLRAPDADVRPDLGAAFRIAFERGRYTRLINYVQTSPAPPEFSPDDAAWVTSLAGTAAVR
jgi:hypothetical protein